jgi:hypothetical protein
MKVTKRQLSRIIKEAMADGHQVTSAAGRDRYIGKGSIDQMKELTRSSEAATSFLDSAAEKAEEFHAAYGNNPDAWAETYEDHTSYTNVFEVPVSLYKDVFFYIADEGMSVRNFQRKISGL